MEYCLACGKLRETHGGFCAQCKIDEYVKREPDRKVERARKARGKPRGDAP